ncbi:hypothetical protein KJ969_03065, partial [Patescibacteria group bacterium]|nr:hypothetical protein [Patescibacteria group bacterium]
QMLDTLGELATGRSSSTNFQISAGYRQGIAYPSILQFTISAQKDNSRVSYIAFDNINRQVTLSSSSGYAVHDHIIVIENFGATQFVALGQITNIAGNVVTVDKWDGKNASMNASPAGSDDWVYKLEGHSVDLGLLTTATVKVGTSFTQVTTNAENGCMVSVREDGGLRYGSFTINDVTDGSVSAGSEEYGIETVGSTASGTGDFPINNTGQSVQVSSTHADKDRMGVIYKASVDSATEGGGYGQVVSFYITANF